jgi:hypothetical protein
VEPLRKEKQITFIFGAMSGFLHSPQKLRRRKWNRHTSNVPYNNVLRSFVVIDVTRELHEINYNLISDPYDPLLCRFASFQLPDCFVGQRFQCAEYPAFVVSVCRDQEIHVHRRARMPRMNHGKAPNDNVLGSLLVEMPAKCGEISFSRGSRL